METEILRGNVFVTGESRNSLNKDLILEFYDLKFDFWKFQYMYSLSSLARSCIFEVCNKP